MSCGFIYKIVFPNGKHYIGLTTTSLEQRKKQHKNCAKRGDKKCLYNALRKYEMVDTFELIEIDTADTIEELFEMEIRYIIIYNSYYMDGNGYNMTYGGEGVNGYVYTETNKQKMSEIVKRYFEDNPKAKEEHGERIKKYYEENPEARKKCSERMKKHFENQQARKKCSEKRTKYYEDNPEAGKEQSKRLKKYYEDNPEAREKCSESQKIRFENPEERKKCSVRMKKHYENPEARKEYGEKMKKYFENHPESRKKQSESLKKYYENPEALQQNSERLRKHYKEHPETKQKMLDKVGKNKPFDIFTTDGTFIKTCTYQYEAIEYLRKEHNITSTIKISEVLTGMRKTSAGFVFKYI
jgi:hypothetical protein